MPDIPEETTKEQFIKYFSQWFEIKAEVKSECKAGRIDIRMFHKTDILKQYPFGVELKRKNIKRGTDLGEWVLQASEYAKLKFDNRFLHVFIYPQISDKYLKEGIDISQHDVYADGINGWHYNVNSFLYKAFKIGEVQKYKNWRGKQYCRFVLNNTQIWDSSNPMYFNIDKLNNL